MATAKLLKLDEDITAAFDRYISNREKAKKAHGYDKKAKDSKAEVIDAMGDEFRAVLADGRIVQRIPKSRKMPARPAGEQSWEDLIEVES